MLRWKEMDCNRSSEVARPRESETSIAEHAIQNGSAHFDNGTVHLAL